MVTALRIRQKTAIGVLALQGAFIEHIQALKHLGINAPPIRLPEQLDNLGGLIIPGGESTTIGKLMALYDFRQKLITLISNGFPVWGTCAGLILLARKVTNLDFTPLGVIDIEVSRNAFGRQVDSFETDLEVPVLGPRPFPAVLIRAPVIDRVGPGVEVLSSLPGGTIAAARQRNVLVTTFHPELTRDKRFHQYFINNLVTK